MLIRQTETEITLQCDSCGSVFYANTADPSEARLLAEADGWSTKNDQEVRADYCNFCDHRAIAGPAYGRF